ncbi:MAG TPA: hypothetical protein VK841_09570 [Polyangiaceae bacterium]|nr:hypothetical protein [Polyangiaceae bacterium]
MNPSELARVSAGLQKQVTRDLGPIWEVSATVDPFPSLEDVPAGYWPVVLTFRDLGGEAGIHVDANGQPYAIIEMSPSWSLTASHVCLEMLTDPFGGRTFPGISPRSDQGDVEFMGGICDACEHPDSAYLVNDVLVSDFCTPSYWERSAPSTERRSLTGALEQSFQVLPGGHLSWYDPATNSWWLRRHADGTLSDIKVGVADPRRGTVREFISGHVPHLESTKMTLEAFEARIGVPRQRAFRASQSRAYWLRASVENLQRDDALRAVLGAARSPRDVSNGRQALSSLLRRSLGASGMGEAESRRVPDAPGATDIDDQTIVVDESVFEKDAALRAESRSPNEGGRPYGADRQTQRIGSNMQYEPSPRREESNRYAVPPAPAPRGHVENEPTRHEAARARTVPPPLPGEGPIAHLAVDPSASPTMASAAPADLRASAGTVATVTIPYAGAPGPAVTVPPSVPASASLPPAATLPLSASLPLGASGRPTAVSVRPSQLPVGTGSRAALYGLGSVVAAAAIIGAIFIRTGTPQAGEAPAAAARAPEPANTVASPPSVVANTVAAANAPPSIGAPTAAATPPAAAVVTATAPAIVTPPGTDVAPPRSSRIVPAPPALPAPAVAPPPAATAKNAMAATNAAPAPSGPATVASHGATSAPPIDSLVDDRR